MKIRKMTPITVATTDEQHNLHVKSNVQLVYSYDSKDIRDVTKTHHILREYNALHQVESLIYWIANQSNYFSLDFLFPKMKSYNAAAAPLCVFCS